VWTLITTEDWAGFIRRLVARELSGVSLVVSSDVPQGLVDAIASALTKPPAAVIIAVST
jgi:transposase-like protein